MVGEKCTEPEKACTLPVSGLVSKNAARFWVASPDGSLAYFTVGGLLYEYDASDPQDPTASLIASGAEDGFMGASEDASRIYFVSKSVLVPGVASNIGNLYYLERGESPHFIGTLAGSDLNEEALQLESKAISNVPVWRAARVSSDGLYATFMSSAPLTGFDNTDQRTGEADREVFVYDAAADGGEGRLVCVSCEEGVRPVGRQIQASDAKAPMWAAARIPTWMSSLYPSNPLTVQGSSARLFFDSFVPLTPRDTNEKADVYEWLSAPDKAACEANGSERYVQSMAGCLSLISDGEGDQDSEFIDADPTGKNVFFATGASLLRQDPGSIDIYDARADGGFPAVEPFQPCAGEACQSPSVVPNLPGPASGVNREGNPKRVVRCAKGKRRVKRKGNHFACVAKKQKRHKKKHHKQKNHSHKNHGNQPEGTHRNRGANR
jgi:hypothetical protein